MKYVIGGMKYSISKIRASVNIAISLSEKKNRKVLLIDADPFTCAKDYARWINFKSKSIGPSTIELKKRPLKPEILKFENQFDDIVIDCGIGENLKYSLEIADRTIVPFNAKDKGLWNLWTLANMETFIDQALDINPDLKAYSIFDTNGMAEEKSEGLIKALKESQYIEFLGSEDIRDYMFATDGRQGKSLRGVREFLELIDDTELI